MAGLVARAGGAMMGIGLVLMVSAIYGSYGLAGALAAANAVCWAFGTAVLSNLVDRFGQRRVMYPAAILSAAALAVTVVLAVMQAPAWTLFAPVMLSGAVGGSPGALVRARWSYVTTEPGQLHTAYSLESTLDEVTYVIGPVLATALSTTVHPAAGLVAPIILGLVGAWWFYSQRVTEPPVQPRPDTDGVPAWRRLILLVPGVGAVVAVNLLIGAVFGSIDISVVAAATDWGARVASGIVLAIFSVASALAGLYYGSRPWHSPLPNRFAIGVVAMFAATMALGGANSIVLLSAVGVLVGLTVAPTLINGNTLIEHLVHSSRLTEGLAWMGTGIGIGASIGSSVAGHLIDVGGHQLGLLSVGGFGALAAMIALLSLRQLSRAASEAEPAAATS
jgi:MFS family permease